MEVVEEVHLCPEDYVRETQVSYTDLMVHCVDAPLMHAVPSEAMGLQAIRTHNANCSTKIVQAMLLETPQHITHDTGTLADGMLEA